jgi:hypothetical protein
MTKIPNPKFYAEIPFVDCPEAVWVEVLTHKSGFVTCEDWKTMRPLMIMIDPEGKKEIFEGWTQACRYAGGKNKAKCNLQMKSVRDTIEKIDQIAGQVLGPVLK